MVRPAHPNQKYDWARWFARRRFTLVAGRDYHVSEYVMRMMVHNAARRFVPGKRVEILTGGVPGVNDGNLTVTVTDRSPRALRTYGGPPRADRQAA